VDQHAFPQIPNDEMAESMYAIPLPYPILDSGPLAGHPGQLTPTADVHADDSGQSQFPQHHAFLDTMLTN